MTMPIVKAFPPNIHKIAEVFPAAVKEGVIFAYGDRIFNPSGIQIPPSLLDHERVHCERQRMMGVDAWWNKYLVDPKFRYEEELLAHRAEYAKASEGANRQQRRYHLHHIAKRLASPLYGRVRSLEQCKKDIEAA